MRFIPVAEVPLAKEVYGVASVKAVRCSSEGPNNEKTAFVAVWFDHERILSEMVAELFRGAVGGPVALTPKAERGFAHYLWSRLHPDIGDGARASLGKRKVNFKALFGSESLVGSRSAYRGVENGLKRLEEIGREVDLTSFIEWKKRIHFEAPHLITSGDMLQADQFFATHGAELTKLYIRKRRMRPWRSFPASDGFGREFNKRMRRDSRSLADKANLSQAERWAATLISHRYLARLQNSAVQQVYDGLPAALMDPFSELVFRWMWWSEPAGDDEVGRFDIPVMCSPVLGGAISHTGAIGMNRLKSRYGDLIDELFVFARTGKRNRAVDIALGFGASYRHFLDEVRAEDRERKRRTRRG